MDWLAELRKINRMAEVLLRTIEERGEPVDEKLAVAIPLRGSSSCNWSSLRRMAEYLSMRASGLEAVNREEVIRWLYGKEPADEYKPLIEEMAHPNGLTAPEGAANQEVGRMGGMGGEAHAQ